MSGQEARVHALLSEALNYDDKDMPIEAYNKYCESMNALMSIMKHRVGNVDEKQRRLSTQSVQIAQKCIGRMSELLEKIDANTGDTLVRRLSQLSPVCAMPEIDENMIGDVGEVDDGGDLEYCYLGKIVETVPKSPTLVSPEIPQSPSRSPSASPKPPLHAASQRPIAPTRPSDIISASLRNARQQFEQTKATQLDPKKSEEILSSIIQRRQKSFLNERIPEFFHSLAGTVKEFQQGQKEKADEAGWRVRMVAELEREDIYIIKPLLQLLALSNNPICGLSCDFITRQRSQLERAILDPSRTIQKPINEIHLFTFHLISLLKYNHPEMNLAAHGLRLKLTIQHYLFTTPLRCQYLQLLRCRNAKADADFFSKCINLTWTNLFDHLGIKEKFRFSDRFPAHAECFLRSGEGFLAEAVKELQEIHSKETPFLKLTCFSDVCNSICEAVNMLSRSCTNEESNLGSEDLLLLLSFVLIRACPSDIHSQFQFISDLIPEEILRGESGYVLATLQTAIHHIEGL